MAVVHIAIVLTGLLRGIVFGGGETLSHVADLDLGASPELEARLGAQSPALAWKYEYFSIFFLDVWTGDAELVLYDEANDERYLPLSPAALEELTGRDESSFSKPLSYHFPLGWLVFGAIILVGGVGTWRRMRELP